MSGECLRRSWRQRFRFSVRVWMILVLLLGGGLGWIVRGARVQREAVAAIRRAGGSVRYNWEWSNGQPNPAGRPWAPGWLVDRIGIDYFGSVTAVYLDRGIRWGFFRDRRDLNPILAHVGRLKCLEWLYLNASSVTDDSLVHLRGLTNLRVLGLDNTDVGDEGLAHLKGLTNLGRLILDGTRVSDAGLVHVGRLRRLETLILNKTSVTDAGMVHLQGLTKLQWLQLDKTQISDVGLVYLRNLSSLMNCDSQNR
jgi:internalin A